MTSTMGSEAGAAGRGNGEIRGCPALGVSKPRGLGCVNCRRTCATSSPQFLWSCENLDPWQAAGSSMTVGQKSRLTGTPLLSVCLHSSLGQPHLTTPPKLCATPCTGARVKCRLLLGTDGGRAGGAERRRRRRTHRTSVGRPPSVKSEVAERGGGGQRAQPSASQLATSMHVIFKTKTKFP